MTERETPWVLSPLWQRDSKQVFWIISYKKKIMENWNSINYPSFLWSCTLIPSLPPFWIFFSWEHFSQFPIPIFQIFTFLGYHKNLTKNREGKSKSTFPSPLHVQVLAPSNITILRLYLQNQPLAPPISRRRELPFPVSPQHSCSGLASDPSCSICSNNCWELCMITSLFSRRVQIKMGILLNPTVLVFIR